MDIQKRCQCCGKQFIAHSIYARFCSKKCTDKAYKEKIKKERYRAYLVEQETEQIEVREANIGQKPILSPTEAAQLIGVSRATIYRYLASGAFKCLQVRGRTFIRRADIEKAFEKAPVYKKRRNPRGRKPALAYYTTREIMEKYNVGKKCVLGRCQKHQITKFYQERKVYWNKAEVDKYFAELVEIYNRQDYYSTNEIMEKFNMSRAAVLAFVQRHNIPRVGHGKQTFYSKTCVNRLKGVDNHSLS